MGHDSLSRERGIRALLFVSALLAYVATATPGAFWLDSSELAAAGVSLGVPHPPGHPLYVALAYLCSLIPVGAIGFRVALLSAALGAAAVALTWDLVRELSPDPAPRWPAALAAVCVGTSQAVWLQSVRAEVYTLQLALALGALVLALRWSRTPAPRPPGPALQAAFLVGLGAANHHLLMAFWVPALLVLVARVGRPALRHLPGVLAAGLSALALYAALPLRGRTDPEVIYGDPTTASGLWDIVSAQVFQRSVSAQPTPLTDNLSAALSMFQDALGPLLLVLAPIGVLLLARRRPFAAAALVVALAANLATKVMMVLDPSNPDAAGYFQAGIAVTAVLAALPLVRAASSADARWRAAAAVVGALAAMVSLTWSAIGLDRVNLSEHRSPALVDAWLLDDVEPDALVLGGFFALRFDRLYQAEAEGFRPDVLHIHQGFEGHIDGGRPTAERLRRRDPRLGPMLDELLETGAFPAEAVLKLAAERPIYVEPTLGLPLPPERLAFAGGLLRVLPPGAPPDLGVDRQSEAQSALWRAGGVEAAAQREARTTLSILWLQLAVVRLQQGSGRGAELALELVEKLSPRGRFSGRLRPAVAALRAAEEAGDEAGLAALRGQLRSTDFGGLFN